MLCVEYLYSVISQFEGLNVVRGDVGITHLLYLATSGANPLLCLVPTKGKLVMISAATGGVTIVVSKTVSGAGVDLASILLVYSKWCGGRCRLLVSANSCQRRSWLE